MLLFSISRHDNEMFVEILRSVLPKCVLHRAYIATYLEVPPLHDPNFVHSRCVEHQVLHTSTVVVIFRKGEPIKTGAVESTRKVIAHLMTTTIVDNTFIHI